MSTCLRAIALVIFSTCGSLCAHSQTFQDPIHRTELLSQPTQQPREIVVRGQDATDADSSEDVTFDESLQLESGLDATDFESQSFWQKGSWYSEAEIGSVWRTDTMFGATDDWDESGTAPRLTIGWENEAGVGVRGELWHYEKEITGSDQDREISSTLLPGATFRGISPLVPQLVENIPSKETATSIELDLYKKLNWGNDELTFGTGLKSADFGYETTASYYRSSTNIDGVGFSLFANARKSIYANDVNDFALVAGGRTSLLWGDNEYSSTSESHDIQESFGIYEASVGMEWRRQLRRSVLTLRTQYETQLWDIDGDRSLGFTGVSTSVGITW